MKTIFRTCIVTREKLERDNLLRIVKTSSGEIQIEKDKKLFGRGAYIKKDKSLVDDLKKRRLLDRALRTKVPESFYETLKENL